MDGVLSEIHRSNMTKFGVDDLSIYREDGKVIKGPDYEEPRLHALQFPVKEVYDLTDYNNVAKSCKGRCLWVYDEEKWRCISGDCLGRHLPESVMVEEYSTFVKLSSIVEKDSE